MAGIKISRRIKESLPAEEREGVEQFLWDKSGGLCHLCEPHEYLLTAQS
jgi:hypothetical protein